MIAVAALLLALVMAFTVAVMASNPGVFDLSLFGAHVPVTASGVYFNGAGAMLVLILALSLLRRGVRRELRRRRQVRSLRTAANGKTRLPRGSAPVGTSTAAAAPAVEPEAQHSGQSGAHAAAGDDSAGAGEADGRGTAPATTYPEPVSQEPSAAGPRDDAAERQALLREAEELTGGTADR